MEHSTPSFIDLHIHSNHSDGLLNPRQILEVAQKCRLSAISITDHDTISAIRPAFEAGREIGIEVTSGVEFSSTYQNSEIHILGYFIESNNKMLNDYIDQLIQSREVRAHRILDLLKKINIHIPFELVKRKVNGGAFCRPHIADVLVDEGYCFSLYEAFEKYLGQDKPAYVAKKTFMPEDVIRVIKGAGGLAFLAHPVIGVAQKMLPRLHDFGFDGIEVMHPKHSKSDVMNLIEFARQNRLLCCGGSDCHGARPGEVIIGSMKVPYHYLQLMKEAVGIGVTKS